METTPGPHRAPPGLPAPFRSAILIAVLLIATWVLLGALGRLAPPAATASSGDHPEPAYSAQLVIGPPMLTATLTATAPATTGGSNRPQVPADGNTLTTTPTSTDTATASTTATATGTPTATASETPSSTDTDTPSNTPISTTTNTPSSTPTTTVTETSTATPSDTATATDSPTITSTPTPSLAGIVVDATTGSPLAGALAAVLQNGSTIQTTSTDSGGNYSFTGLAPGTYQLTASVTGYETVAVEVGIFAGQETLQNLPLPRLTPTSTVTSTPTITQTITITPTLTVTQTNTITPTVTATSTPSVFGTVYDLATGQPLVGATVDVTNGTIDQTTSTDASGYYQFAGLQPGSYQLSASLTGYQPVTFEIPVTSGSPWRQDFPLPPNPTSTSTNTATTTASPTPSDTATPSASSTATSTLTVTPTATQVGPHLIYLPYVSSSLPPTPTPASPIVNGGFENGLTGWQSGGALGVSISTSDVHSGAQSALLGNPSFSCTNVPVGEGYVSQTITVPSSLHHLTFWYHLISQDVEYDPYGQLLDTFDVYVNGSDNPPNLLYRDANPTNIYGCNNPVDLGWKSATVDLSAYAGQTITLYFSAWNRMDGFYNTWVYLDDVALSP